MQMESDIVDVMESALALAGYKISVKTASSIIIRHPASGLDYQITVEEEP